MVHHTLKGCPHISDAEYLERLKRGSTISESGCWEWNGFRHPPRGMKHHGPDYGYGEMCYRGKGTRTHRLAWILTRGPIPNGMVVMHTCDNPPCCNPEHVRLGTQKENQQEMARKGRGRWQNASTCIHGHEYTPENTYLAHQPDGKTKRHCKTCKRLRYKQAA